MARRSTSNGLLLGALLLVGCYAQTQRFPAPMVGGPRPLPPGVAETYAAGPEEVTVVRHGDPIHLRRPGEGASFPLHFYRKQARVNAGSWVLSAAGGMAELLFARDTRIVVRGESVVVIGSPSRGEPVVYMLESERVELTLSEGDYVELLGGSRLTAAGGPFVVEHGVDEVLVVRNRSTGTGTIAYREALIELAPGEVVHLPLLESSGRPRQVDPAFQALSAGGGELLALGAVELVGGAPGRLRASGEHELRGHGLVLRLDPGDEVVFDDLGRNSRGAAPPAPETEPETGAPDPEGDGPEGGEQTP
jgi:hypothetical protein